MVLKKQEKPLNTTNVNKQFISWLFLFNKSFLRPFISFYLMIAKHIFADEYRFPSSPFPLSRFTFFFPRSSGPPTGDHFLQAPKPFPVLFPPVGGKVHPLGASGPPFPLRGKRLTQGGKNGYFFQAPYGGPLLRGKVG